MLRYTYSLTKKITPILTPKFSQLQKQHKQQTPIQKIITAQNILAQKQLQNNYNLINSSPNDSIDEINQKFITLKQYFNSRHYIMPNKKQHLERIDRAYQQVMKVHEDYNILQIGKNKGLLTKEERIVVELKRIRKAKYIRLMQTYQFVAIMLGVLVLVEIFVEEYKMWNEPRVRLYQQFQVGLVVGKFLNKCKQYIRKILIKIGEMNDPSQLMMSLQKMGIKVQDPKMLQMMKKYSKKKDSKNQTK